MFQTLGSEHLEGSLRTPKAGKGLNPGRRQFQRGEVSATSPSYSHHWGGLGNEEKKNVKV